MQRKGDSYYVSQFFAALDALKDPSDLLTGNAPDVYTALNQITDTKSIAQGPSLGPTTKASPNLRQGKK